MISHLGTQIFVKGINYFPGRVENLDGQSQRTEFSVRNKVQNLVLPSITP